MNYNFNQLTLFLTSNNLYVCGHHYQLYLYKYVITWYELIVFSYQQFIPKIYIQIILGATTLWVTFVFIPTLYQEIE